MGKFNIKKPIIVFIMTIIGFYFIKIQTLKNSNLKLESTVLEHIKMHKKQKIAIGINFFTAITQLVVSSILIIKRGLIAFQYYTMDSNIFAAVTSIFLIISLLTKKEVSENKIETSKKMKLF